MAIDADIGRIRFVEPFLARCVAISAIESHGAIAYCGGLLRMAFTAFRIRRGMVAGSAILNETHPPRGGRHFMARGAGDFFLQKMISVREILSYFGGRVIFVAD